MSNITTVGVIGAGTMGSGIAQACAVAGLNAVMVDIAQPAVDKGLATIAKSLERLVAKDKLSAADRDAALARIKGSTSYDDLKAAQFIVEAATEKLEIKSRILQQANAIVAPEVPMASNTSSISITALASASGRPDRFVGMHFFNPVPMMTLVEVIPGMQTSEATRQSAIALAETLGKTPVAVKNGPGFAVNRILIPMINEAFFVLSEGLASAEDIDTAMKLGCNHPIGPLALADLIGLDVCLDVLEVFLQVLGDSKYRPSPLLKEYVEAGYLGRKSGRGVYTY